MATTGDVQVGDIGTTYRAQIQDRGVPFDPTSASVKRLIWSMPSAAGPIPLERDAQVQAIDGGWYLVYTVTNADADDFHTAAGKVRWQGFVQFAGGERYSTNIEEFTIKTNLPREA